MSGHGYGGRSTRSRHNDEYDTGHNWSSARSGWSTPPKTTVPRRTTQSTRVQTPPQKPADLCRQCNQPLNKKLKCTSCGSTHVRRGTVLLLDGGPTLGTGDSGKSTLMLSKPGQLNAKVKPLKATARNVAVFAMDMTGSMGTAKDEIIKRAPVLYSDLQELLGDDVEILLITFGDAITQDEIRVVDFGRGPILDIHVQAVHQKCRGGGNRVESQDLVALYLDQMVDFTQATNVFVFFVTDEGVPLKMDRRWATKYVGEAAMAGYPEHNDTTRVFDSLAKKAKVFTILKPVDHPFNKRFAASMRQSWATVLASPDFILDLSDIRRCVDVAVGAIAKSLGKLATFEKNLAARQTDPRYRSQNIQTVMGTIMNVPGGTPNIKPPASVPDFFK